MRLDASFSVHARDVRVDLEVPAGKTVAIVGENGSGKSTVLQVIAGLVRADEGRAVLGATVLFDERTQLPAHQRRVAMLAQEPRLFPRMTARRNVEFALRARAAPRSQASDWLQLMSAEDLADRRPGQLSGGQQQRVAIARALAAAPELLLMDEPMAALDAPIAADLRHRLREVLGSRTALVVTHEILDAALLADEVVVMQHGRVVEAGPTSTVMRNPRTGFAASLCGLNLIQGRARTQTSLDSDQGLLYGLGTLAAGSEAFAAFPPAAVAVYTQRPHGSPRNVVAAQVRTLTPHGQVVRVDTSAFAADLTPGAVAELALAPGMEVSLVVKANEVRLYSR